MNELDRMFAESAKWRTERDRKQHRKQAVDGLGAGLVSIFSHAHYFVAAIVCLVGFIG